MEEFLGKIEGGEEIGGGDDQIWGQDQGGVVIIWIINKEFARGFII